MQDIDKTRRFEVAVRDTYGFDKTAFWQVTRTGADVLVEYGEVESAGAPLSQTHKHASVADAKKYVDGAVKQRLERAYTEIPVYH